MVNVVPREVPRPKPSGPATLGFWPWDLPRHNIHHDTSSAFSNNVPVVNEAVYRTAQATPGLSNREIGFWNKYLFMESTYKNL